MSKKFSAILTFILWCASGSILYSQNTFWTVIKDSLRDNVVWNAIEMYNGDYVLADFEFTPFLKAKLIKLNNTGGKVEEKYISGNGLDTCVLGDIIRFQDDTYLFGGWKALSGRKALWLVETDAELNILKESTLLLKDLDFKFIQIVRNTMNKPICVGTVWDTSNAPTPHAFVYRVSEELDSIQFKIFSEHWAFGEDMIADSQIDKYYFLVYGYGNSATRILVTDTTMNILKEELMQNNIENFSCIGKINEKDFIFTGEKSPQNQNEFKDIAVEVADTMGHELHYNFFGKPDTTDFPGYRSNLSFIDPNSIFIGGTANFQYSEFSHADSWFSLYNIDSTLNLNWEKYYGGDGFYTLYSVCATSDGGCLMAGSMWDYHNISSYVRYPVIIKVDKTGFVSITDQDAGFQVRDAILYPNPGTDFFIIKSGPQIKNSIFTLYDLQGRRVIRKVIDERSIRINTANLPSGMYIWRISEEGKVIERGKWIKE